MQPGLKQAEKEYSGREGREDRDHNRDTNLNGRGNVEAKKYSLSGGPSQNGWLTENITLNTHGGSMN